jgi:hypothetical protein
MRLADLCWSIAFSASILFIFDSYLKIMALRASSLFSDMTLAFILFSIFFAL